MYVSKEVDLYGCRNSTRTALKNIDTSRVSVMFLTRRSMNFSWVHAPSWQVISIKDRFGVVWSSCIHVTHTKICSITSFVLHSWWSMRVGAVLGHYRFCSACEVRDHVGSHQISTEGPTSLCFPGASYCLKLLKTWMGQWRCFISKLLRDHTLSSNLSKISVMRNWCSLHSSPCASHYILQRVQPGQHSWCSVWHQDCL